MREIIIKKYIIIIVVTILMIINAFIFKFYTCPNFLPTTCVTYSIPSIVHVQQITAIILLSCLIFITNSLMFDIFGFENNEVRV